MVERMLELRAEGLSNAAIGKALGIDRCTVQKKIGRQPASMTAVNHAKGRKKLARRWYG